MRESSRISQFFPNHVMLALGHERGHDCAGPIREPVGDPNEDYFARGFVGDVATELSRFGTLEVLYPRAVTAFLQAHAAKPDSSPIADHLLRGSIRRAGDMIRIAVQLIATGSGRQVWADRYDAQAADLLAVQDEIAARMASALAIRVDEARLAVAQRAPLASLEVYDCWLRGMECLRKGTVEAETEAPGMFRACTGVDPTYSRAYSGLSLSHFNEWSCQAWEHWDEKERLAYDYATRAVALDDGDAVVQVVLGRILLYRRQFAEGIPHVERALTLNPNDPDVLIHAALCRVYLGEGEVGVGARAKSDAPQSDATLHGTRRPPEWRSSCSAETPSRSS